MFIDLKDLYKNINATMYDLDRKFDTDAGGCVLASYAIAKNLKELDILYKVVVYASQDEKSKDIRQTLRNDNLCHMCISINDGKGWKEIGGEISKELMDEHGLVKYTADLTPDELIELFDKNVFNGEFDRNNAKQVISEIDTCFEMCI